MESSTPSRDTAWAMSQENVDRFLELADAFNRGDLDAASDWLGPEVVFEPQAAALEGNVAGPDGVRTFMAGFRDLFEVFELRYTDVRDLGDRVLALGTRARSVWPEEAERAGVLSHRGCGDLQGRSNDPLEGLRR